LTGLVDRAFEADTTRSPKGFLSGVAVIRPLLFRNFLVPAAVKEH